MSNSTPPPLAPETRAEASVKLPWEEPMSRFHPGVNPPNLDE